MNKKSSGASLLEKPFWSVTWPIIIDLSLGLGLMFTDFFFLSRISDVVAAAVGAILPIIHFTGTLYFPLAQGCAAILGQALGAKQFERVSDIHAISIILSISLGLILCLAALLLHRPLIAALGLTGDMATHANQYLQVVSLSFLFIAISKVLAGVMRSHGQSKWVMYSAIIINTINIIANGLFLWGVVPTGLTGVQNVALATVIATFCGMLWCFVGVFKLPFAIHLWPGKARSRELSRRILKIAGPAAIEPMNYQICQAVLVALIIPLGTIAIAARTYVNTGLIIVMVFELGMAIAVSAYIAHYIGANDTRGASRELKSCTTQAVLISGTLNLMLYLFSDTLMGFFTDDSAILDLAKSLLLIGIFWGPAKAVNLSIGNSLRATGDAMFSSYIGISMWLVGIPLAYLFGFSLEYGLIGVWIAMTIDENLRALLHLLRWKYNIGKLQSSFESKHLHNVKAS